MLSTYAHHRIFYLACLFFSLLLSHNVLFAAEDNDMVHYQAKLEKLQNSIAKIQQHLKGSKTQRSDVLTELKNLEQEISNNTAKLNILAKDVHKVRQQRTKLKAELKHLDSQIRNQQAVLSEQVRSAYSMGHQQNLKMLLNQQNPAKAGRTLEYFDYLNRARADQINVFHETINKKQQVETALEQTFAKQNTLLQKQKVKKRKQQKQRLQRKNLLTELSKKIKTQENTLYSLENSRSRIENLLKSLGELLADIPTSPSETQPFATQKGKFPWPAKGTFLGKFGQSKNNGDLRWNGVLIKANFGTPVRVISHGRVAFSDWLQGFGFITIVDHGNGYMSLYGHSETLFKQTGDWVRAGDVIATAGDSGGQPQSGVYFEIRARGKPVNPAVWCSTSVNHT
ncbi:MAG: peptidoglycan DD-metalloendopeptidase family protein [Gammaproteobacteria bacterium]|nr:peptidoglycan DD-metalloendopeptidase family protein [Gammaproteobacteria bacterium]